MWRPVKPVIVCTTAIAAVLFSLSTARSGAPQAAGQQKAWERIKAMAGVWRGEDHTKSPPSQIERVFEMIVKGQFMLVRTKSVSPSETHEDWAIFSYDRMRKKVMMRQFASEGFVNRFVLDAASPDGQTLTFLSEDCENAPPGFRVRMEYTFEGEDAFAQRMDLASPGREFSQCVGGRLRRE